MLILSKGKDYYDGVAGTMGVDKTIVYERNVLELDDGFKFPEPFKFKKRFDYKSKNPFHEIAHYNLKDESVYKKSSAFIVGFCGKLYVGWKFVKENKYYRGYGYGDDRETLEITYDINEAKEHLKDDRWAGNLTDDYKYIIQYDPIEVFRDINAPIFIFDFNPHLEEKRYWCKPRFTINPNLKEYGFYKAIDAFTAFQEIQMFISGVLGVGEKDIIVIDDKHKIKAHGFDKWSFRKEPKERRN